MKKICIVVFLLSCFILSSAIVNDAMIGNPNLSLDGNSKFEVGLNVDQIADQDLRLITSIWDTTSPEVEVEMRKHNMYLANISFILFNPNNLKVTIRSGLSEIEIRDTVETENDLIWGGDISGRILKMQNEIDLGLKLSYLHAKLDLDTYFGRPDEGEIVGWAFDRGDLEVDWNRKIEYSKIEADLAISKNFKGVIPYGGITYRIIDMEVPEKTVSWSGPGYKVESGAVKMDIENENEIGIFFGTDLLLSDSFSFSIESRFFDEAAISSGCTYRF